MARDPARIPFFLLTFLLCLATPKAGLAEDPVRLAVETDRLEVAPGETVELTVKLQDADGEPAAAPRDLVVRLVVEGEGQDAEETDLTMERGKRNARHEVEAGDPGLVEVRAEHPELRGGGAFFHVTGPREPVVAFSAQPHPGAAPQAVLRPTPQAVATERAAVREAMDEAEGEPGEEDETAARVAAEPKADVTPELIEPLHAEQRPRLILRSSPRRGLLANGKDSAKIYAFLEGGGPLDYTIRLIPDAGRLDPLPLRIPSGASSGTATLTASRPGRVQVEYVSAEPALGPVEPQVLEVDFEPPITALELAVRPSPIRVGQTAEAVARLVDAAGTPVKTATERQVKLDVETGRARLGAHSVTVPAGAFEARTTVTGEWWGDAEISASSPNLLTRRVPIAIQFPWALLAVTMVGSLAGGLIAWTYGKAKRHWLWQRLFTGLVTGLVFYWLLLFTGIVPSTALANPLGVFAAAVLGGWLGTEVFDLVLDRLGLRTEPQPAGA